LNQTIDRRITKIQAQNAACYRIAWGYLMVEIWLPYGSSDIPARIPEERLAAILKPHTRDIELDVMEETKRLIKANQDFQEAARNAKRICIVETPNSLTRLTSSLTQTVLEGLAAIGIPPSSIAILGTAGAQKTEPTLLGETRAMPHTSQSSAVTPIGDLECGFPVSLSSSFIEADMRIVVGELKPHCFLGYCGLSDAIFPGLASQDSILSHLSNRKGAAVSDLARERVEIANSVKNLFSLGFVLDANLLPAKVSLGSFQSCLDDLKSAVQAVCSARIDRTADVVIMSVGGRPTDESLLTAVETLPAAIPALKKDGVLIVAAECSRGHGDTEFYEWCAEHKEPRYLEARLRHNFNYNGFKAACLLRTIERHRVYLVSTMPDHYVENVFGLRAASTVNAALQTVQRSIGSSSTISVVPDASRTIPVKTPPAEVG
jgi:lactate racemase